MPQPQSTPRLILASRSPRRAEILTALGVAFDVDPSDADEDRVDGEAPAGYVVRVARAKAAEVAARRAEGIVVGADTAVVVDGMVLGKPADADDAARMLRSLAGRWHAVMTGVAVRDARTGREVSGHDKTLVRFRDLTDALIEDYVGRGEGADKAGAYAIQGRGMLLVEEIAGNYHNVVGFPPTLFARLAGAFDVVI